MVDVPQEQPEPQQQQVQVPPDVPWRIDTLKLSDGTFIMVIGTPNILVRLHMQREDLRSIAANLYQQSTGIVVPEQNGHREGPDLV